MILQRDLISLSLRSSNLRQSLFVDVESGKTETIKRPYTLRRRASRARYKSLEEIDYTFKLVYLFLQDRAGKIYSKIDQTNDPELKNKLLVKAEINNPEVQYNLQFSDKIKNNPRLIDFNLPVYRYLVLKHWKSYGQMLLMQRLETFHSIPDTFTHFSAT